MDDLRPTRVVALTSGRSVPSARFRVRQHIPLLREQGVEVTEFAPRIDKYLSVGAAGLLPAALKPVFVAALRAVSLAARRPGIRASRVADVTWLERELIPGVYSAEGQLGRPFVFDVDDAIWAHRDARHEQLRRIAGEAAVLIAGNTFIAEWFHSHPECIEVIPTAIDTRRFRPRDDRETRGRLRIGWTGTSSNFAYLESIEGPLSRFLQSHDAELVIVADKHPQLPRIPAGRLVFESWSEQSEAEIVRRFDIGLMPLFDDEWGRGKCGFKVLQYMACGVPAVVAPVGFNRRLVATGGAIEAESDDGWVSVLSALASNHERRSAIGFAGRAAVERDFSCEVISRKLAAVLRRAATATEARRSTELPGAYHREVARGPAIVVPASPGVWRDTSAMGSGAAPRVERLKIGILARSLGMGGAERQITNIAAGLSERGHSVTTILFYEEGSLLEQGRADGLRIETLGKAGRWDVGGFAMRLMRVVNGAGCDVVYSFLEAPNVIGVLLRRSFAPARVVWGIRSSNMDFARYGFVHAFLGFSHAFLSRFVDGIVFNSRAGLLAARARGVDSGRSAIIPNGIDLERFRIDEAARSAARQQWGVAPSDQVVGMVARLDPVKDHETFLAACSIVRHSKPRARFVCVGGGDVSRLARLRRLGADLGLEDRLIWIGERRDVQQVINGFDVNVLCSTSEGFPNSLAEALACGVPCVSTNAGDAVEILGPVGEVVPPRNAKALAAGILRTLTADIDRSELRRTVEERFSMGRMIDSTEAFLRDVVRGS